MIGTDGKKVSGNSVVSIGLNYDYENIMLQLKKQTFLYSLKLVIQDFSK